MFLSNTEILILRLCAWCKDLPLESPFLPEYEVSALFLAGLLRTSKNHKSIRVTEAGNRLLSGIGFNYEQDAQFRGASPLINKRLNTSNLMLFFFGGKTDVFCSSVPDRNSPLSFLPSFALRREKNKNPLGTARFNGMLYTKNTARAVYYITEENDGLYPEAEHNTFTMNILTGGRKSAAAFTGDKSLERIIEYSARKTTNSRALPVLSAVRRLDCPITFFPLSVNGARQMRIISVRDHRRIIAESILKAKYKPPEKNYYDAAEKILIGIDMDIPRMETAAEYGVHIFLLDWQVNAVKEILRGKRAVLHPLTTETAEEMLRLPKDKAILLVRGAKPLLLNKITPEEHPSFKLLKYCKAAEHIPAWKLKKPEKVKNKKVPQYKMQFEMPLDTDEDEKESFDLSDGIDCRKLQTVKERDI